MTDDYRKYRGPYIFQESIKVVVNGVTFWVDLDNFFNCNNSSGHHSAILSWRNENEKQQVTDALVAAHKLRNELLLRPVMNYEAIEAHEKATTWKLAFWLLLAAVIVLIIWLAHGM